jgi:hypothetical protein
VGDLVLWKEWVRLICQPQATVTVHFFAQKWNGFYLRLGSTFPHFHFDGSRIHGEERPIDDCPFFENSPKLRGGEVPHEDFV